jgi:hypothetical protein
MQIVELCTENFKNSKKQIKTSTQNNKFAQILRLSTQTL